MQTIYQKMETTELDAAIEALKAEVPPAKPSVAAIWAEPCVLRHSGCRQSTFSMQSARRGTAAGSAKLNN